MIAINFDPANPGPYALIVPRARQPQSKYRSNALG